MNNAALEDDGETQANLDSTKSLGCLVRCWIPVSRTSGWWCRGSGRQEISSTRLHTCSSWSSFTGLAGGSRRDARQDAFSTARRPLTTGARGCARGRRGHGARSHRPCHRTLRPPARETEKMSRAVEHCWCFEASNSDLVCV